MTTLATRYLALGLILISRLAFARSDEGFGLNELCCEYAINPIGIDVAQPRLSWKLTGKKHGLRQTAYHIKVFSYANLATNSPDSTPDLWDSGKVVSDETHLIRYEGKTLESSQQVFWSVRVWDENDQASSESDFATWTMGLLRAEDWQAKWICAPAASESLLMRKEIFCEAGIETRSRTRNRPRPI